MDMLEVYNSELWNTNSSVNKKIEVIQRRFLKKILNIRWPKRMSNERLCQITKQEEKTELSCQEMCNKLVGSLTSIGQTNSCKKSFR